MKKFIRQVVFFLAPIVITAYFVDVFISKNLKKSNSYAAGEYSIWNDVIDGKINSDIVIYGSSRAWVQINPTMLFNELNLSTYNLGIDGHNFWLQYLRHSLLIENNVRPKLIIHSVDVFTLLKKKDLYNFEQFLPYMLWNDKIKDKTISYNGFDLIDYEIPLIRYFKSREAKKIAFSMAKISKDKEVRIKGYQAQDYKWNSDFDEAKKKMKNYDIKLDNASILLFDKYLKECQYKNIKIILVYTPEYIEGQKFVRNRDSIISLYRNFSKKYNIPFYDYSNDSISFKKKYFYNAEHLNKTGSELFTQKLIDTLKNTKLLKSMI
ncbi:hypothetical protein EV143_101216 [Flavobacterium chryseum]|uniref:hypothetical protein n=1 Tax=Flavobacterium sp. P3160 TaxID=2512113 RepID=UPI00105F0CA8|nr:hypothetical protein [Flavobacterium sp. P3160]TDO83774.1 hypothetical protein EV143_101216 [Flavobacterium sp. P3160]